MKIVITGNMGCGKSTADVAFKRALPHYSFFDFDACVAEMYKDEAIQKLLDRAFGTHIKSEISPIVHSDHDAMMRLRHITDAYLITAIQKANKEVNVIFDIPLFFEFNDNMHLNPDLVFCVTADLDAQIERVKRRNGHDEEMIRSILSKQYPQDMKVDRSDIVLHNNFASAAEFETYVYDTVINCVGEGTIR